jgi:precorrin-6B C5,15-methyltransferase / cobalt-precorrin-6B C5,C15-methyltransferase
LRHFSKTWMAGTSPAMTEKAAPRRWLSIVGIGEDGADGLSPVARNLVSGAELVFGGKRHLALAGALIRGEARAWPSPFDQGVAAVLAARGRGVCVLASGDPFHYGVGAVLARHVDPAETVVVPAASAFSLAAARLGWPLADCALLSLHGRALDLVRSHLQPGGRVLALTSDADGPAALARLLGASGFGPSRMTVLEALGGPRETIRAATAAGFDLHDIDALNTVAIEVAAAPGARIIARAAGLPDDLFEHDGQITKREIRAVTLSALAPRRGETLWDIGAGAGSVAIEWMLADVSLRAVAFEANADRAARIARNAAALGVPGLEVVHGTVPDVLMAWPLAPSPLAGEGRGGGSRGYDEAQPHHPHPCPLPTRGRGTQEPIRNAPDAIFVGGGCGDAVLDAAIAALRPGGRLVVNAVTLETEALLIAQHARRGGTLTRIAIERAEPIGAMTTWRPALPVTQWRWIKSKILSHVLPEAAP